MLKSTELETQVLKLEESLAVNERYTAQLKKKAHSADVLQQSLSENRGAFSDQIDSLKTRLHMRAREL